MNQDDGEYGVPDEESPEITDEEWLWFVRAEDFDGFAGVHAFLREREDFLREAEAAGIPRTAFLSLEPNKPGFIRRATEALEAAARAGRLHAAE
ncbi:hypothetical protein [Frigidibacter oleivorans]|uniref:hypothetical protein n=1 Tax=Frigidibacter oleivorans TaxID=2487129 RepID=UPI000F8E6045|nr:hypothetical protein [Frigidibacter oleivorans]